MSDNVINTTCGYCSTGCNMTVQLHENVVVRVNANSNYPVNLGKACPKGFQFLGHLNAPNRAISPYVRDAQGQLQPVDWETALRIFVDSFKSIQKQYGNEAVAFLNTGQITNEEFTFLGALAKFGMGFIHGDGNTRQCMATAAVAHKESFGFDSPPFTYKDFEESDVMVFIGSNPVIAHPIMWNRVKMNKNQPKIVVLDPRRTETASSQGVEHYPLLPKSDLFLLYGLANLLIEMEWIQPEYIETHTIGFQEFKSHVRHFTLEKVSRATGLDQEKIKNLAETIHNGKKVSFWWMVGINQGHQATRTAQAIINLALMTGNIGRPGTGANSITGQCNAMGSRLFGNTTSLFCGRSFLNDKDRQQVAEILGINQERIPNKNSLPYDKILEKVDSGQIKGLWIICTNPVHSWIDTSALRQTLRKAQFIVVQDMFHDTATAQFADLVLAAGGCGEKNGTFINSERRIGLVRKISSPPGQALPDFEIFKRLAQAWGCDSLFRNWSSPEAVFQILKQLSKDTPCDFSGTRDYAMIEEKGGIQWPLPAESGFFDKERRLFEGGTYFHPDGKARFLFEDIIEVPDKVSEEYPFVLMTGRGSVSQWHTLTRTDKAPILKRISPDASYVEISPRDAGRLGIVGGEVILVSSPKGQVKAKAKISESVQPGHLFMPMHYDQTNILTFPSFDPYSGQPSFKYAPAGIKKLT